MIDDRLPILLVILDGLGDRAAPQLGHRTPAEVARTPVLDELCTRGVNGVHVPFGPGRTTSSEFAHWGLFGFADVPFPGRAALEALGVGHAPPVDVPHFHYALRHGEVRDGARYLSTRATRDRDEADCEALFAALDGREVDGVRFERLSLRCGECVLMAHNANSREISDTDSLFDHLHPWMRPVPLADAADPDAAGHLAGAMETWLREGQSILAAHPVNRTRRERGFATLDTPVTKWASRLDPAMPSFEQRIGFRGAAVTDTVLYRGLARCLGMTFTHLNYDPDHPSDDMRRRLGAARELMGEAGFVHVHVKATDEAGHTKQPANKVAAIEAADAGLEALLDLADEAVVAVTGDHATPSVGGLLHSGDPTPFVAAAPGIRPDATQALGEGPAHTGELGALGARDVMPLLIGYANRPFFLGHRPGPWASHALPDRPEPMPIDQESDP
ncbi:MAG: phosphoglycerate mutase [Pseudomonadota bacterium]